MTSREARLAIGFGIAGLVFLAVTFYVATQPGPAREEDGLPGGPVASMEARAAGKAPELYPDVPIAALAKWVRPRATITGTVTLVRHEADGDHHMRIEDGGGNFAVAEEIPELPLKNGRPKVGQKVRIWGVVRWDAEHKWPEIHPAIGWALAE